MSDEYDDDDFAELMEDEMGEDLNSLTPEEVFKIGTIRKSAGTMITAELRDEEGDVVNVSDIVAEITNYVRDKITTEESSELVAQVMPLMSQTLVSGLGRMIGLHLTGAIVADETLRHAIVHIMCIAFLLLKFVQQENLKIHTLEEKLSEEELENILSKSTMARTDHAREVLGLSGSEVVKEMLKQGLVSKDEIAKALKDEDEEVN